MPNKWLIVWVVVLLVVSAGLPIWHYYGMNRSLVLGATGHQPLWPYDDRGLGGASVGTVTRTADAIVLKCDIKAKYAWPYCSYSETIAPDTHGDPSAHGYDLSKFTTVAFNVTATGPMPVPVRIYFRNFNPAYSRLHHTETLKVNTLTYVPVDGHDSFVVPLANFQVASWWIQQFHIAPQDSSPDLSNVTVMDVSTGDGMIPGNYTITVRSIAFVGKWLTEVQVLSVLLALWLLSAMAFLANSFWLARREAQQAERRKSELEDINAALELKRHELETMANHDELTGAYNRVGLRNHLVDMVSRAKEAGAPLSIVFMDLDHFKSINDRHGHLVGDEVLKQFAVFVGRHVRDTDLLCRWGGEEFILLCGNTPLGVAVRAAERLCALTHRQAWPNDIELSCSFGVAQMLRSEDMGSFIKRADEALYRAKNAGRNRVAVAGEPGAIEAAAG